MKKYRCEICGEISTAKEWNNSTMKFLRKEYKIDDPKELLTSIEDIVIGDEKCEFFYPCPNCNEKCYNGSGEITEVTWGV